jgi:hypothetical protein
MRPLRDRLAAVQDVLEAIEAAEQTEEVHRDEQA